MWGSEFVWQQPSGYTADTEELGLAACESYGDGWCPLDDEEQIGRACGTSRAVQGRSEPQGSEVRVGTMPVPQGGIRRLRVTFMEATVP